MVGLYIYLLFMPYKYVYFIYLYLCAVWVGFLYFKNLGGQQCSKTGVRLDPPRVKIAPAHKIIIVVQYARENARGTKKKYIIALNLDFTLKYTL